MTESIDAQRQRPGLALVQVLVLIALCILAYLPEADSMLDKIRRNPEMAHALAAPALIAILVWLRRDALCAGLRRGSPWGILLLLFALGIYFVASWPFNYGQPRHLSLVLACAGSVLAVCGWRVLWLCIPMLLVVALAVPIGSRYWAFLVIVPETMTLSAVAGTLDMLPGVLIDLEGSNLSFSRGGVEGTIALGESNPGVSMLLASLTLAVVIAGAKVRPFWQELAMYVLVVPGALAVGAVLLCNYLRLLVWSLISIYGGADPVSAMPRIVSSIATFVFMYLLVVTFFGVLAAAFTVEAEPAEA